MTLLLFLLLQAEPTDQAVNLAIAQVAASGRVVDLAATPSERVAPKLSLTPGPPPLLSFRYYEGKMRGRNGNYNLVLDDAGH